MKHSEGFLNIVNDAKSRIREVTVAEARARNAEAKLIDVREDNEWEAGHAAGAIHLGKGIIERDIENTVLDKATRADSLLRRWLSFARSRQTRCKRWVTRTCSRWRAAGRRGKKQAARLFPE